MDVLTIGELAREAGVNVETVRYYERRGLIEEPPRSASGYRQYSSDDLWRLRFIGRAKQLGFTLREITEIFGSDDQRSPVNIVEAARAKLASVEARQQDLVAVHGRLERLVDLCESGDPGACAALDVVS
ncbi:MAG: MerR family transcriptional regulator [Acidimicrobiia bacterium]|nr:MerR family transcriptional regulator [Acidimicrobiia bacterium]